jgi:hypothetical protein
LLRSRLDRSHGEYHTPRRIFFIVGFSQVSQRHFFAARLFLSFQNVALVPQSLQASLRWKRVSLASIDQIPMIFETMR